MDRCRVKFTHMNEGDSLIKLSLGESIKIQIMHEGIKRICQLHIDGLSIKDMKNSVYIFNGYIHTSKGVDWRVTGDIKTKNGVIYAKKELLFAI